MLHIVVPARATQSLSYPMIEITALHEAARLPLRFRTTPGTETVVVTQEDTPVRVKEVIEGELVEGEIEGELPTEGEER